MAEEIRLSRFGKIGFTFLIILLILLLGATMGVIIGSKTRIKLLENRIAKLENINYRLTEIWEQIDSFDRFKDRLDKLEVSLSKTENFVKNRDRLPKKIADTTPPEVENPLPSKITPKIAQKQYHTVTSGDTLFSISHRYGLSIEKIRHLNKLTKSSVIYPGQKLLVSL
jgi:LysM repeat protein